MMKRSLQLMIATVVLCASSVLFASESSATSVENASSEVRAGGVPEITSALSLELEFGRPFQYVIQADNEPLGFAVQGMPVWMKRKGAVLTGNAVESGDFLLKINALNSKGVGAQKDLKIHVKERKRIVQGHPVSLQRPDPATASVRE